MVLTGTDADDQIRVAAKSKALLVSGIGAIAAAGDGADASLDPLYDEAIRDTIAQFEATGSPVITDG